MKDKQQTGLPNGPGSNPEGSKGAGSRDVRWTPGPWEFNGPGSCGWVHVMGHPTPNTNWCVATCTNGRLDGDGSKFAGIQKEAEANARLIAAAPELYEALEDVERMFTSFPLLAGANSGKVSKIRAVLAKARGEL